MRRFTSMLGSLALGAALVAPASLAGAASSAPEEPPGRAVHVPESDTGSYVVLMDGAPLVTTEGREGVQSQRASDRGRQMRAEHARAAQSVGAQPVNDYTYALNGFSAVLEHDQAVRLATRDDVRLVIPDIMRQPTTDSSGDFLGLTGPDGAYAAGVDGEDVVVGVIDTGIWPEHPSFADDGNYDPHEVEIEDVHLEDGGVIEGCDFGNTEHNPDDAPFECNNKLLGARQMLATYRALIGAEDFEFDSARDDNGHGSHTASTAAGNADVPAEVNGHDLGEVTGIAHRARVVAYKGLGALGGFTSDLAAAIDQAVADGVDVINYSIGGGPALVGADEIAFLFAADAGVHVASSAGNSGPGAGTIGGPASAPWLTTVGASTQTRFFQGTVHLGNSQSFDGASLTGTLPAQTRFVDAADATRDGDDLCVPGTLRRGTVRGAIVLCRRGEIARVDKSLAVAQAGGVGMVLYNNSDEGDLFTDNHHVPSVHVDQTEGLAIKEYIDAATGPGRSRVATAAIVNTAATGEFDPAPSMTSFSSRGPDPVAEDIIKPDVTGPGLQILAAASPYADPNGNDFQSIGGTSMSSPHVAGLFALLDQQHPDLSPAMAKSAMMTTAHQDVRDNDRTSPAGPFDMGAGHVDPGDPESAGSSFNAGLAYDAGLEEYIGFLCGAEPEFGEFIADDALGTSCDGLAADGVPTEARDLNLPSIGVASVPGSQTVTRTVTSIADDTVTYTAMVDAPDGFDVEVSPSTMELEPGEEATFTVTFDVDTAEIGEWRHGSLTWESDDYAARSPISVRASLFDAPAELSFSGESGTGSFDVSFGYSGPYTAEGHGLIAARVDEDVVEQDPDQTFDPDDGFSNAHEVEVTDAHHLRFAIPPDATEPNADLDLFLFNPDGELVATSTTGGTDELIDIGQPMDGTWTLYVHGWSTPGGDSPYELFSWVLPTASEGSLTVTGSPGQAVLGLTDTVEFAWDGATAGEWHLGALSHNRGDELLGLTLVEVDNQSPSTDG